MTPDAWGGRRRKRIGSTLVKLALASVLGGMMLLTLLWVEHRTEVTLPTPAGSFAVGRAIYAWVDDVTVDTLAPVAGIRRELLVWIWYPSTATQSAAMMDDYLPALLRAEIERARGPLIKKFLTRDLSQVHGHSVRNADVSPQQPSYPVVIVRAGASSTLAEDRLAVTTYCVHSFFDAYLKGASRSRLEIASAHFPEIQVLE